MATHRGASGGDPGPAVKGAAVKFVSVVVYVAMYETISEMSKM